MLSFEWKLTCDEVKLLMASSKTMYSLEIFFLPNFKSLLNARGLIRVQRVCAKHKNLT